MGWQLPPLFYLVFRNSSSHIATTTILPIDKIKLDKSRWYGILRLDEGKINATAGDTWPSKTRRAKMEITHTEERNELTDEGKVIIRIDYYEAGFVEYYADGTSYTHVWNLIDGM